MDADAENKQFRLAMLHIEVGGDILRNLLNVKLQTAFLDEYASRLLTNPSHVNFCSILLSKMWQQFRSLDPDSQAILKPLLETWKGKGHLTLSKQVTELEKWNSEVRSKLDSGEESVRSTLVSWENQIKDDIQNISPLLVDFNEWNAGFIDLWDKYHKDLLEAMQRRYDQFISTCSSHISQFEHPSRNDLKTFSNTFLEDAREMTARCNKDSETLLGSWAKDFEELIKKRYSPELTTRYDYFLQPSISDDAIKDCLTNMQEICSSWYSHLTYTVTAWQKLTDDVASVPADALFLQWLQNLEENPRWVTTWQRHTDHVFGDLTDDDKLIKTLLQTFQENPSCQEEKLQIFFRSEPVLNTLKKMRNDDTVTKKQSSKWKSTIDFPDLLSLDMNCLLILLKKHGHVENPELGWQEEISETDFSIGADLLRLESYRNDLIRSFETISIHKEAFTSLWKRVEDVLNRLATRAGAGFQGKIRKCIENVKTCDLLQDDKKNLKSVTLNWCKGAILADLANLSLSGKFMASTDDSYIEMARSVKRSCYPLEELAYSDQKDVILEPSGVNENMKENFALLSRRGRMGRSKKRSWVAMKVAEILSDKERAYKQPRTAVAPMSDAVSVSNIPAPLIVHQKWFSENEMQECGILYTDVKTPTSDTKYYDTKPYGKCVPYPSKEENIPDVASKFLDAIKNNDRCTIDEIFNYGFIPKKDLVRYAFEHYGDNTYIHSYLKNLSSWLLKEITQAVGVWCGYRTQDPHTPVFIVTLRDYSCIINYEEIPPSFDYEIVVRYKNVPNDEERTILKMKTAEECRIRAEDAACVHRCIAINTERLMREHSNLSVIRVCPVRASGYLKKELKLVNETCIVLSIPVKGIIPIGEKEFSSYIDDIKTDVREGEFIFFGDHKASEYQDNIRMGSCISTKDMSSGTLGGFVDLPGERVGCITAAHVVLTKSHIHDYIHRTAEEKQIINQQLENGQELIEMYQPDPNTTQPFGTVRNVALEPGTTSTPSVDAALIQITDECRRPDMGNFPEGNFEDISFTKDDPMLYNSGEVCDEISPTQSGCIVIKFGKTTGITRGCLSWNGASVRPMTDWGDYPFQAIRGQMMVETQNFAYKGDSGALVFLCVGGNIRKLAAVGMVIGGNTSMCSTFITPIRPIFKQLGLTCRQFKAFHPRQLPQNEQISQPLSERMDAQERVVRQLNEKFMSLEENMKQGFSKVDVLEANMTQGFKRVDALEQNITDGFKGIDSLQQNIHQRFQSADSLVQNEISNVSNSMTQGFRRVDLLEQNISDGFKRVDALEQNMHQGFQRVDFLVQNEISNVNNNMTQGFSRIDSLEQNIIQRIAELLNRGGSNE